MIEKKENSSFVPERREDRLREKHSRVDPMRYDFIAATSHGFRTHLTSIKGYISLILSGRTGDINQVQREFLTMVSESAENLHKLIDSILDLTKLDSGRITMKRTYIDINKLVEEEVTVFQAQAKSKGITVKAELEPVMAHFRGDGDWLKVAMENLIDNAIKYTKQGGVVVKTNDAGENVRISVIDNGVGIDKKDFDRVFDPFQRSARTAVENSESSGLGLAITRSIIECHGGKIWVESKANQGSKFIFTLPKEQRKHPR